MGTPVANLVCHGRHFVLSVFTLLRAENKRRYPAIRETDLTTSEAGRSGSVASSILSDNRL